VGKLRGVDGDGEGIGADFAPGQMDQQLARASPAPASSGRAEVPSTVHRLEAQGVRAEHAVDELTAPGQLRKELHRWEGDVQEEADVQVGPVGADQLGHQAQVIVVHPHRAAVRCRFRGGPRETAVDGLEGVPPAAMENGWPDLVVIERPERLVSEALVVLRPLLDG
jgi:hypothetical protein